jgi:hypothetical protein
MAFTKGNKVSYYDLPETAANRHTILMSLSHEHHCVEAFKLSHWRHGTLLAQFFFPLCQSHQPQAHTPDNTEACEYFTCAFFTSTQHHSCLVLSNTGTIWSYAVIQAPPPRIRQASLPLTMSRRLARVAITAVIIH